MRWPFNTSESFIKFQDHLLERGQIHLAELEREVEDRMKTHLFTPEKETPGDCDCLAKLLLLRYCIAWAVASGEDLPPLVEDDHICNDDLIEPHRKQLANYSSTFPEKWRKVLSRPESHLEKAHYEHLTALLDERRPMSGKGSVYMPALLFSEQIDCHAVRDMIPPKAATRRTLWGTRNFKDLVNGSRRSRYWMDRLVRATGIGCTPMTPS